jgi:hypothetical protein
VAVSKWSETKSFRLDEDIVRALEQESERSGESANHLTNKILLNWMLFDRYLYDFGYVTFPASQFVKLLELLSAETVDKIGEECGKRFPKDLIRFTQQPVSVGTCSNFIQSVMCNYMHWGKAITNYEGLKISVSITHSYGSKWSRFLSTMIDSMFTNNLGIRPEITVHENGMKVVIPKQQQLAQGQKFEW